MNTNNFFTRRILGMDYRVWEVMLFVCFFSLGLYGYKQIRFNQINDRPCPLDTINVNGKKVEDVTICYLDRYSLFEVQSEAAETVEWNFGDGTIGAKGRIVSHKFKYEGSYRVRAIVNGGCEFEVDVEVSENPFAPERQTKPAIEVFAFPMHPAIGKTVKFYCVADMPFVTSYEWKILNTDEVQKDAVPAFTFHNEGPYTIELIINNDPSTKTTRVIEVTADMAQSQVALDNSGAGMGMAGDIGPLRNLVPPGETPTNTNNDLQSNNSGANNNQGTVNRDSSVKASSPKAPEVDPNAFKELLQNVIDENGKELEDLYEYLDYKASTMVEVNESGSLIPLKEFCKNMRDKKKNKRKIESLSFKMDDKKSIRNIHVKVPKSESFWQKINPFN